MRSSAHGCCLKGLKPLPLETEDAALLWRSCVALSMLPEGVVFTDSPSSACCPCPGPLSVGLLGSLCAHHRALRGPVQFLRGAMVERSLSHLSLPG